MDDELMSRQGTRVLRFEDLKVWQAARDLVKGVYRATRTQKLRTDHGLSRQMQAAAVSVTSNIAEGFERGSRAQNAEFCFYAKGSAGELRSQVINAHDLDLIDETAYTWLYGRCQEVSAMLAGYIKHLSGSCGAIRGMRYTSRQMARTNCDGPLATTAGAKPARGGRVRRQPDRS